MKTKMLATAVAACLPLLFGAVHAQTTTTPESGKNRSSDGGAMTTNPTPAPGTGTPATTAGTAASTEAITGWSARHDIIGKTVVNENNDKIGEVKDVVIASDGRSMYVLVGAGGFLGMGEKDVAVPFDRIKHTDKNILLSGYSKEQLKALPEVRTRRGMMK